MFCLGRKNAGRSFYFPICRLAFLSKVAEFGSVRINPLRGDISVLYFCYLRQLSHSLSARKIDQIGNRSSCSLRAAFLCRFLECFVDPAHLLMLFPILVRFAIFPDNSGSYSPTLFASKAAGAPKRQS